MITSLSSQETFWKRICEEQTHILICTTQRESYARRSNYDNDYPIIIWCNQILKFAKIAFMTEYFIYGDIIFRSTFCILIIFMKVPEIYHCLSNYNSIIICWRGNYLLTLSLFFALQLNQWMSKVFQVRQQ